TAPRPGGASGDGRWEVQFIANPAQAILIVRVRASRRPGTLAAYALQGADGARSQTGFLLLRPEGHGEAIAAKEFRAEQLEGLGGECQAVTVCPLEVSLLTAEEVQQLDKEIRSASPDERASWRDRCEAALRVGTQLPEPVRRALVSGLTELR